MIPHISRETCVTLPDVAQVKIGLPLVICDEPGSYATRYIVNFPFIPSVWMTGSETVTSSPFSSESISSWGCGLVCSARISGAVLLSPLHLSVLIVVMMVASLPAYHFKQFDFFRVAWRMIMMNPCSGGVASLRRASLHFSAPDGA